ncbi:MAG: hypothetical protein ACYTFK_12990 [Planctomycetota bacterium]|jgi:hypothetical protein
MAVTDNISKQWFAGGVDAAYIGFYDTDGLFVGGHGTLQRAEQSWMRRWQGIKSAAIELPARNRVTITGDDRPQGFLTFDRTDSPTAAFQTSNHDQDLESEFVGLNDYARNQQRILLFDPKLDTTQNVAVILQGQSKAAEYGVAEQSGWEIHDLWKGQIDPGSPSGLEEQTGHAYDFVFAMERQSVYPDNVALVTSVEGTDEATGNVFADKYRFIRGAVKGDGTLTEINLPFTPAADDTDAATYAVEITKRTTAGVVTILTLTTDYTITTSPARVTLTSPALYDELYTLGLKYAR